MATGPSSPRTAELAPLEAALASQWPPPAWRDVTVVAAVSGGPDSVALVRALAALRVSADRPADQDATRGVGAGLSAGRLVVAHVHHGLRGDDANGDQLAVQQLADRMGILFKTRRVDVEQTARGDGDGLEAAARKLRYRALRQIAHEVGARYVAIAHTADDQIETILHRIVRGTGVAGLAGMPRARRLSHAVTLIRPLLEVRRQAVVEYLASFGEPFRIDATNADRRLTRARIRHELLPALMREYNPRAGEAILRLGRLAGETQGIVDQLAGELLETAATRIDDRTVRVARAPLAGQPRYLVGEVLVAIWRKQRWPRKAMDHRHWRRLVDLALGEQGDAAITLPGEIQARLTESSLELRRLERRKGTHS